MTLPTSITFPLSQDYFGSDVPPSVKKYLDEYTTVLKDMYTQVSLNLNGFIRTWTPTVFGGTNAGTGTYSAQYGFLRRSGIVTELWFDVGWTAHSGTGDLLIQLPYIAAVSIGEPWIGVIESVSASNSFTGGYTYLIIKALQNTSRGAIYQCGSGVASIPFPISGVGRFAGYIQYLGKELERQS